MLARIGQAPVSGQVTEVGLASIELARLVRQVDTLRDWILMAIV